MSVVELGGRFITYTDCETGYGLPMRRIHTNMAKGSMKIHVLLAAVAVSLCLSLSY